MKMVKIGFFPIGEGEIVSGTIAKLRRKSDSWVVDETLTVVSNGTEPLTEIRLDENQRLVIDVATSSKVVMDKEQNAAVQVPVAPKAPAPYSVLDGEERDTPPIAELAIAGVGMKDALTQEQRDRAVTEARNRLKEQQKAPIGATEIRAKEAEATATAPFQTTTTPSTTPPTPPDTPPVAPTWPPKGVGGN